MTGKMPLKMPLKPPLMIPHGADILVCDGSRALVLHNAGTPQALDIKLRLTLDAPPNPPTHEQGTDRPPRVRSGDRQSAIDQTDWHDWAERRFAEAVVGALERLGAPGALVVVAPPRMPSNLRRILPESLRRAVMAEIDKDLTKDLTRHTVEEIGRRLSRA